TQKYQSEGGPGLAQVLGPFAGSDEPLADQATILKAQLLFWLIGATDGHAKNFSLFLGPGGTYRLTPLYDILSTQPSLDAGQIKRKQLKLAMSVGRNRHYKLDEILPRHFFQTGQEAGLSKEVVYEAVADMAASANHAIDRMDDHLQADFPEAIHEAIRKGLLPRLNHLSEAVGAR
ncbi:MAG: HipA domain-containing protein, partial [Thiohalorhabdaceae bacterium]